MLTQDYQRSVERAVQTHGLLAGLVPHLLALPEKVSGLVPYDVVALTSVQVADRAFLADRTMVAAHTLALRGYDANTSLAIWQGFRENFPEFSPETAMLMSKGALHEKYGRVNGDLIAAMLLDPGAQPILHKLMLSGMASDALDGLSAVVERDCVSVQFRCTGEGDDLRNRPPWQKDPIPFTHWQVADEPVKILDRGTAAHAYAQATGGGRLPAHSTLYISPHLLFARGPR